ncbi:hypothetical protein ES705_41378 [subsurface metagenome]
MRSILFIFLSIALFHLNTNSKAEEDHMKAYLFPGQGSDHRLFQNLHLNDTFDIIHIQYPVPDRKMSMKDYARLLADQIDTTEKYVLIGVSLGGMICTEMNDFLKPEKTILISSAKRRKELPGFYRFMKYFPVYRIIPKNMIKGVSFVAQPFFEPDRKNGKKIFVSMLRDLDPTFLKRSINMIVRWDRTEYSDLIVHFHGDNDHTLPIKNIQTDHVIEDGSHLMVFTRGDELSSLINDILK